LGWPDTEMPNSVSVPITRRTLMQSPYAPIGTGHRSNGPVRDRPVVLSQVY
jgi:hypothetical protein